MFKPKTLEYNFNLHPTKPGVITLALTKSQRRKLVIKSLIPLALFAGVSYVVATVAEEVQKKDALDKNLKDFEERHPEN